jgi:hypothetical protein
MLATATEPYFYAHHAAQPLEVHRSKIGLTRARPGYDYPTIRLPFAFSGLIGLSTRIYQTVHDGALAFLVVVSPRTENANSTDAPRLYTAGIRSSNLLEPTSIFDSEAGIVPDDEHDEDEKLHNSIST